MQIYTRWEYRCFHTTKDRRFLITSIHSRHYIFSTYILRTYLKNIIIRGRGVPCKAGIYYRITLALTIKIYHETYPICDRCADISLVNWEIISSYYKRFRCFLFSHLYEYFSMRILRIEKIFFICLSILQHALIPSVLGFVLLSWL